MTTTTEQPTTSSPGAAFAHVMTSALDFAAAKVSHQVDGWSDRLNDAAESGGAKQQAGASGAQAGLQGKNPVWAAIKGAWSGGSAKVRAAIVAAVVAVVLMLVLSPVLLLLFLLGLLVIAATAKARSAKQ